MFTSEEKKSDVTRLYEQVTKDIPSAEMQEIVYDAFNEFWRRNHAKPIAEKCVEFALLRQFVLSSFHIPSDASYKTVGNTIIDYFDMTFAYLFFNGVNDKCPLENKVDNEFYFCLLTFALDRIEFPSLVMEKLRDSYYSKNRNKVSLQRRNYLATLMVLARQFSNGLLAAVANQYRQSLTYEQIRRHYKLNMKKLISSVGAVNAKSTKYIESRRVGAFYKLYRGYEIDSDQNVILCRKLRVQDANKSVSFTTERKIAELFANYRHCVDSSSDSTSFEDRLTLAKSMFKEIPEALERASGKKSIVSEYEFAEEDIVLCPISTTITECEVFAFPDKARLTRYTITHSC